MDKEKVKEIKEALKCCGMYKYDCEKCPYKSKGDDDDLTVNNGCGDLLLKDCLTLINDLEGENEALLNENWDKEDDLDNYHIENQELQDRIAELTKKKDEQLKHFAEGLKDKGQKAFISVGGLTASAKTVTLHDIDETLKEFLDGKV